ncbi:MAG TPA: alpha/beta fold hydrolase, partial [Acetobacteraceae bacterium]|nr:alpha/beta fold hydrolase [Acetobacteraceae bacterium]
MPDADRRTFVLVHGAWHGAWVWRDVLPRLRALGHEATALTLTGLGERRHLGNGSLDLETHIEDLVTHIEMEDLRDITLVGWSYGGMVITGGLARVPERISRLVYLDAFMPEDGKALVDYIPEDQRWSLEAFKEQNMPLPPIPLSIFGVTDPHIVAFIEPRLAAQPWRTFYQPVKAMKSRPNIPVSYVVCTGYAISTG